MQDVLTAAIAELDPATAAATFILVPTRAAGEQLRRTVEDRLLSSRAVLAWPRTGPRGDFYRELAARVPQAPPALSSFDREVLLARMAREVASAGLEPPFALRPSLVAEMLALYDHIRRQARTIEDFDRNLRGELEPAAESDRGAAQLLRQTAFLSAVFAAYERNLVQRGVSDEHGLRAACLTAVSRHPLRHVVVTVGDRTADPDGLWPVDFTLLSALPRLATVDVIATETLLAAGLLERIHAALPGLEEVADAGAAYRPSPKVTYPRLAVAAPETHVQIARDREDELAAVARRIKGARRGREQTPLARQALIVRRPLPYLYLARSVFGSAGIPFETLDTLPLAAEPYAAALDLALDAVVAGFSRPALLALLRSPHFAFDTLSVDLTPTAIAALDRSLATARYLGGLERLTELCADWIAAPPRRDRDSRQRQLARPALEVVLMLARELAPLGERRLVLDQLGIVRTFLSRYHRESADTVDAERSARVRRAVADALSALASAYAAQDPAAEAIGSELSGTIRRWLGAQTFALRSGAAGVRVLDAQAARFADVDEVQVLGLVEGEWPEPPRRSIFYAPSLLGLLDPAPAAGEQNRRESETMAAARAAFVDLLCLARHRVRASAFALESDAVVEPSPFADEVGTLGLQLELEAVPLPAAVFVEEALLASPPVLDAAAPLARAWAALRRQAVAAGDRRFLGEAGPWVLPRVSVSRVDRYLKCPFQFFASEVLGLDEEPEDGDLPPPWERGRFLHAIFERFFTEWQQRGRGRIAAVDLPEARTLLEEICEGALVTLPPHEAGLERARLYGSAASAGIIDRVLSMEAERPALVERRLVEFELDASFAFRTGANEPGARTLALRAKVDRVDLLAGGSFRVIDYKSKLVPDLKRSVQLQVYTSAVAQQLDRAGDPRQPAEAYYLSLEGETPLKALRPAKGQSLDELLCEAEQRMVQALDDIGAGHFPARPSPRSLCNQCPFDTVCRKAFVEPDDA
jgi:RecB family exonuclease